jgi:hypothetical protein
MADDNLEQQPQQQPWWQPPSGWKNPYTNPGHLDMPWENPLSYAFMLMGGRGPKPTGANPEVAATVRALTTEPQISLRPSYITGGKHGYDVYHGENPAGFITAGKSSFNPEEIWIHGIGAGKDNATPWSMGPRQLNEIYRQLFADFDKNYPGETFTSIAGERPGRPGSGPRIKSLPRDYFN